MAEIKQVQIRFTEVTEVGEYSDALYYPYDAYVNGEIKEADIIAEKASRIANFVDRIKNPPAEYVPTDEELLAIKEAEVANIEAQKAVLDLRLAEVSIVVTETRDRIDRRVRDLEPTVEELIR